MGNKQSASASHDTQGQRHFLPEEKPRQNLNNSNNNQRQRNLLPKEKLKQKRQQSQNKPIIEFPEETKTRKPDSERDSVNLKRTNLGDETQYSNKNGQYHQRQPPMPRHYENLGDESHQKTDQAIRNDIQFPARHSYDEENTDQARYARHHWWANMSMATTRERPTYRPTDSTKFGHKTTASKPNSQKSILKRGDDERYSRQKPTEKPKGYVLVRREGDNVTKEEHDKMGKTGINNSEYESKTLQNTKHKTSNGANLTKENIVPNIGTVYPQKKDSKKGQTTVNSEKMEDSKTNARENIQSEEGLNQWMKGSRFWN